jgi:DNA mismatch repair protein MutL
MTLSPKGSFKNPTNKINLLPEHIIDQIKAGEVIERPATLLKELMENSVDAGSTKISVHIINFGLDLISVEDNGIGIDFEDLPLAFCRHATSKIENFDDLYKLYTYGFRGEALASMASVSKVTCTSNKVDQPKATIKVSGAEVISHNKQDSSQKNSGTGIYVKDLFFNTPVRMKFLQSQTSERNQLKRIINAFILTHPEIEFSIKWDDGIKEVFPIVINLQDRIKKIFEKKKDPLDLINFESEYDGSQLEMFISLNSSKGYAGKFQYIFINDRFVQDVQIHKIVLNSAQSLWPLGETGNYIAFLTVSPDQLDVNVHPNKTVIKLFAASSVFSLISSSIKKHLPKIDRSTINLPSQVDLSIDRDIKNFGGVQYKSQNFNEENALQNYFNDLDQTSENNTPSQDGLLTIHFRDSHATFFSTGENQFICNNKTLFKFYIESLLFADKEKKSTPLLVSTPITIDKEIPSQRLNDLASIGFELDFFDSQTIVLRAFPQVLSSFPFEEILKILLNNKSAFKDGKWSLAPSLEISYMPTRGNLDSIIGMLGLSLLIEMKFLKQVSGKDFLTLL